MSVFVARGGIPLRSVQVRTVRREEKPRWNTLMREHHYLGLRNLCDSRLRQVAVLEKRWLALLGFPGKKDDAAGQAPPALSASCAGSGTCIIADALHARKDTAREIPDHGLHCILTVKGNQPPLPEQFGEDCSWSGPAHVDWDLGRGRIDRREIQASEDISDCPEWLGFPGLRFVAKVVRQGEDKRTGAKTKPGTVFPVTSLPPGPAAPERLLEWNRGYRGTVGNGLHRVMALPATCRPPSRASGRSASPLAAPCSAARPDTRSQPLEAAARSPPDPRSQAAAAPLGRSLRPDPTDAASASRTTHPAASTASVPRTCRRHMNKTLVAVRRGQIRHLPPSVVSDPNFELACRAGRGMGYAYLRR